MRPIVPPLGVAETFGVAPEPGTAAGAQGGGTQQPAAVAQRTQAQIADLLAAKARRTPAQRKVGSRLLERAVAELAARSSDRQSPGPPLASAEQMGAAGPDDGRVLVDLRADVTAEVLARIRELGGTVVNSVPRYQAIRARLPLASVERLAVLDAVRAIRTADEARTRGQVSAVPVAAGAGAADPAVARKVDTSAGDVAHRANLARQTHGIDGTGVGIGVLSDGVHTLAARQASGDLPAQVTVLPGQEGRADWDEGTAMLEIVHDLAPGAELYFATAFGGQAQFAANIEALCEAGADVIIDDIGYYQEAHFQDNVITQGIDAAVAGGCFFFSAAGNDGNLNDGTSSTWEGDYAAGSALVVDGERLGVLHDFGNGAEENSVEVSRGPFSGAAVLQWADPLGASVNDYDLFLLDASGNVIDSSTNTQNGTQDPIEFVSTGFFSYADVHLLVVKTSGANRYLRLQAYGGQLEEATAGNSLGHAAAENAIGVAAVDARDAGGAGGVFDGTESVETYSSDGPRRVFFEADGTPTTPGNFLSTGGELLEKPDLAAAACVSTSTPDFSRFCGTSASAPHAAAIAALMLEVAGGPSGLSLAQLRAALAGASLDIEAQGVDRDAGAGIVMAAAAVDAVATPGRNRAPTVAVAQADRTVAPGSAAMTVDLAGTFTDPEGDTLTYAASSTDSLRLEVVLNGTQLTLTPGSPGRAVVTLRATDPDGLSAVDTFIVTVTAGNRDYDGDNDGLIDVGNLAQLDAVRYDLNGDGLVDGATWQPYYDAFPMGRPEMGCPAGGCTGYELTGNLDFDTNDSGGADAGDTYWNAGAGWAPIGDAGAPFAAEFAGNGRTVANLFLDRSAEDGVGLFGAGADSSIRGVGLIGVDVTGRDGVGSLVGRGSQGSVRGSHATGRVSGRNEVGGLVGRTWFDVRHSYAAVDVSGEQLVGGLVGHQILYDIVGSYSTGSVSGTDAVGGLVGAASDLRQSIVASYASGDVSGQGARLSDSASGLIECRLTGSPSATNATGSSSSGGGVGGLVGSSCGYVETSYATGAVSGTVAVGGLVGTASTLVVRSSYWDLETFGVRVGVGEDDANDNGAIDGAESHRVGVAGLTTAELQAPTGYTGIYETWNIDLDGGATEADDPWDFGTTTQYPVLSAELDGNDRATWEEFGYQLRGGPALTATTASGQARVDLGWTAVDVSTWRPAPGVTYTVYRDEGGTVETVADALVGLAYTDTSVTVGSRYAYRVAVVIDGGEAARSAPAAVTAGVANQPPVPVGALADLALEAGSAAMAVEVAGAFADPDADTLSYGASSSVASVATVGVSGSVVTTTPVAVGRTVVTVTAADNVGSNPGATQRFTVRVGYDYDADGDGLIAIRTLAQLAAVHLDLNGTGVADYGDDAAAFAAAFPDAFDRLGCGIQGCSGYELLADLDFDTNGNGSADAGDAYWNGGAGWAPIGPPAFQIGAVEFGGFQATFDGNGHTLANLFVARNAAAGLFGTIGSQGVVLNLRLLDVDVTGEQDRRLGPAGAGGLAGKNRGVVRGGQATGRVSGAAAVGGLIGRNDGAVRASHAAVRVAGEVYVGGLVGVNDYFGSVAGSHASGRVTGESDVGGLVGLNSPVAHPQYAPSLGAIRASYATGSVSGSSNAIGGLVGSHYGVIADSYATGRVSTTGSTVSGLVGIAASVLSRKYA